MTRAVEISLNLIQLAFAYQTLPGACILSSLSEQCYQTRTNLPDLRSDSSLQCKRQLISLSKHNGWQFIELQSFRDFVKFAKTQGFIFEGALLGRFEITDW